MIQSLADSTILVADDEPVIRDLLKEILEDEGAAVKLVGTGGEALASLESDDLDLAVLDVRMPPPDGLAVLQQARHKGIDIPILIITAQDSSTNTIQAMQLGAYDYIGKPFDSDEILQTMTRALEYRRLAKRVHDLERQIRGDPRDVIIGRSASMQQVYKLIGRVASSNATVLITGETGTGKELVAQVLHRASPRSEGPYVVVNCAALPETLLESELFGHEKGAFTGAIVQRKGRFEQANHGTIFLDEIGEMSASTQKKLLRVLQEHSFERVGGNLPIKVDVRVIAATNRDLHHDSETGTFRDDLYYRLNVVNIHMPPLRERKDDIPLLVRHFLMKYGHDGTDSPQVSEAAMQMLTDNDWPGNVREIENAIERALVLAQGGTISTEHLSLPEGRPHCEPILQAALVALVDEGKGLQSMLSTLRGRLVRIALERSGQDRQAAAKLLEIPEAEIS
jgi:two-component system, NtrC family, response regulator AtoC